MHILQASWLSQIKKVADAMNSLKTIATTFKNVGRGKTFPLYHYCCLEYADINTCSSGYWSFHIDIRGIHGCKRSLNMRGNRYTVTTLLLWRHNQNRNNVTLWRSAGTVLSEKSPHCSDNSHNKLYETMLAEYALGTSWYDKVSLKRYINTETYLLFIHLWNSHRQSW